MLLCKQQLWHLVAIDKDGVAEDVVAKELGNW